MSKNERPFGDSFRPTLGLADDVPAGDLDRRDGGHVDLATLGVDVADHPLEKELDVARVEPDVRVAQLVDRRLDRRREGVERALADAVDALVGVDPHEQPVLPGGADEERPDAGEGFDNFFIDDHVPHTDGDTPWGHRGRAFANGYIQALIEAVTKQTESEGRRPGTLKDWTPDYLVGKLAAHPEPDILPGGASGRNGDVTG